MCACLFVCSLLCLSAPSLDPLSGQVGDSVKDDVVCGNRAGAVSVLLDLHGAGKHTHDSFEGEMKPTHIVSTSVQLNDAC